MKNIYITKIAASIFIAVSIIHLTNFFIGGVISVWSFVIPPFISLVVSFISGLIAFKLIILK